MLLKKKIAILNLFRTDCIQIFSRIVRVFDTYYTARRPEIHQNDVDGTRVIDSKNIIIVNSNVSIKKRIELFSPYESTFNNF